MGFWRGFFSVPVSSLAVDYQAQREKFYQVTHLLNWLKMFAGSRCASDFNAVSV